MSPKEGIEEAPKKTKKKAKRKKLTPLQERMLMSDNPETHVWPEGRAPKDGRR